MTYQIRPVKFNGTPPTNVEIAEFIESNTNQTISIEMAGGQYSIFFDGYPEDVLEFRRSGNEITIYGDAGAAPALCDILYSSLLVLGGSGVSDSLIEFPVTDSKIESINLEARTTLRKYGATIWLVIILVLLAIAGLFLLIGRLLYEYFST